MTFAFALEKADRLARFAWLVLGVTMLVIVWGAYVRASGSGAGCGSHWPLCNGEVVPRAPAVATVVELTHRVTSGVSMILVFAMTIWAFRARPKGSPVRKAAVASSIFMCAEALIGAALVLFELVAHNASQKRALSMSLHLLNTFFLLAAMVATAWWASGGAPIRLKKQGLVPLLVGLPMALMLFVGTSGGIAALGDTLFPATSMQNAFAEEFSTTAHVFVRLRWLHPVFAIVTGASVVAAGGVVRALRPSPRVLALSRALTALFFAQIAVGVANVVLLAPIPVQLVHLVLGDAVWITLVLLGLSALAEEPAPAHSGLVGASQAAE